MKLLLLAVCAAVAVAQKKKFQKKKMILNVDGTVEDAKGLLLALETEEVHILGVICTASAISARQCARNMDRIRRLADKKAPGSFNFSDKVTGADAFGEYPSMEPQENKDPDLEAEFGAVAMARLARENKEDSVVVVATGPLTDVALAQQLDSSFGSTIKALYVLGGNMFGVGVVAGSPAAEYNFFADPEAAHIVFNQIKAPIVMIPHETLHQRDSNEMYDLFSVAVKKEAFLQANSTKSTFIREISGYYLKELKKKDRPYTFGDEIAVASAIRPSSIIDRVKPIAATIELYGQYTRGQVAIDWLNEDLSKINVRVVTEYSPRSVSSMMLKAVQADKDDFLTSAIF